MWYLGSLVRCCQQRGSRHSKGKTCTMVSIVSSMGSYTLPDAVRLTVRPEARRQFEKTSLDTTSSFFWSSPEKFCSPAAPVKFEMPALLTIEAICLQATAMDDSTTASSLSILPACSSCKGQMESAVQECNTQRVVSERYSYVYYMFTSCFVLCLKYTVAAL